MRRLLSLIVLVLGVAVLFLTVGCTQKQQPQESQAVMAMPDTTGTAIWSYLKQVDYQKNWKMWPGKTALYPGTAPHGALLTTYVNSVAYRGIEGMTGMLPDSSLIVKENYEADSTLAATTIMYKVKGYNPDAGDWYWAKFSPTGEVQLAGKAGMCIGCHSEKKDNDYIWTASLK